MLKPIDFRSDTLTQPTPGMREAMMRAEVGDDVMGEDPTVNLLEETVADLLGKEAAVFMPSGTMTNQIGIRAQTQPGDAIALADIAHIGKAEGGAPAALSGVTCYPLPSTNGCFTANDLLRVFHPDNILFPLLRLVALENTVNFGSGNVWTLSQSQQVVDAAQSHGILCHLDGARLWNAVAASDYTLTQYADLFDSVSVCFSKGLGAPVGSALLGNHALIKQARRLRKQWGGGMRQAGIIAAGALYALNHHLDRLPDDHINALRLAEGLATIDGLDVDLASIKSNIVICNMPQNDARAMVAVLQKLGVLAVALNDQQLRFVTHLMVDTPDIDVALERIHTGLSTRKS